MTRQLLAMTALVWGLCATPLFAQELTLGSKAPALKFKEFVKGEPVKAFEKGKVYVVEFWATWCGPCRATIPHLTKLQKKHEKDVTMIGVAVWEEDQDAVADFVKEMGDKMDYRVALDFIPEGGESKDGAMAKNWMEAAEQSGIPASFIVNGDGKVAWIGHPGELDEPLAKVVEGKWDIEAEAKKLQDAVASRKKMQAIGQKLQKLFGEFQAKGEPDALLAELDSASKELPDLVPQFSLYKFQVLSTAKGRVDEALTLGGKLLESDIGDDPQVLNNLAWLLVTPDRDKKADPKLLKFALKAAMKADNLLKRKDPAVADTLAKAYFDDGQLEKAVETQERVIELSAGTQIESDPSLKRRLRQYKRALEASQKDAAPKTDSTEKSESK